MSQCFNFIKEFFLHPKNTGSLIPSSKALAKGMAEGLEGMRVVELGPGTGVVTAEVLPQLRAKTDYVGFEINSKFQKILTKKFPGLIFRDEDASKLSGSLNNETVDVILSTLPFTNMPKEVSEKIIEECFKSIKEGGIFRLFLYQHTAFLEKNRRLIRTISEFFTLKEKKKVGRNIPPAIIFTFLKRSS